MSCRGRLSGSLEGALRAPGRTRLAIFVAAAAMAMAWGIPPAAAQTGDWHGSFEEGLAAAAESRKPIVVLVHIGGDDTEYLGQQEHIALPGEGSARQRLDGRRMIERTLTDRGVIQAAKAFEPVLLDVRLRANDDARERLKVSPVVSEGADQRVGVYPITLFLDANGDELFRRHGYLPPEAYEFQLRRAANLFEKLHALVQDPENPMALREVGRAYMEMDFSHGDRFYQAAVRNLERAIELDRDNAVGAHFDASVDLAILRLPDNPADALSVLSRLHSQDERGARQLEIEYYTAVAHYVLEDLAAARRLLSSFETGDRRSPYFDSPWTSQALGLLQHIRNMTD